MIEQVLTRLALPTGMIWCVIGLLAVLAWRSQQKHIAGLLALLFVIFTLAGNTWTSMAFNYYLEREYRVSSPEDSATFDAVVILGGGTRNGPNKTPQLDAEGDRVMLGARLCHAGCTPIIVCTGRTPEKDSGDPLDAAEMTALLLVDVGVEMDRIIRVGGRYTREEIAEVKRLVVQHRWRRVGIITSAWHMPRAMRLAQKAQLDLTPLPADFRGTWRKTLHAADLIPSSKSLSEVDTAIREILASFVGR